MLSVTFLGTAAACPTVDRNVSGLAVQREGEMMLFDCGEGTQRQMMRYGVGFGFREIFLTHYHSDHILGITGLVRTLGLMDRQEEVVIYGPRPADRIISTLLSIGIERTRFQVEVIEVKPGDRLKRPDYEIQVFATDHRSDTVGYALVEYDRLGRFNPEHAKALGIPEGPMWGKIHKGESIHLPDGRIIAPAELVGPPRPGRKLVYPGDTRPCQSVLQAAHAADLLIHEATFGEDERVRAEETGHSTARQAADVARMAGVKRLVLTHISARYSREAPEIAAEAQGVFPASQVARDGMQVDVPFVV
jgi:ribonuclease Z